MFRKLYRVLLRLPSFRGKARIETVARKVLFTRNMTEVGNGLVMDLDPLEWSQIDLLRDGSIEPLTTNLYGKLLRLGDTYIDVGAHVGFHTLIARHYIGQEGRVIAIEPQPHNCQKIMANWQANDFENILIYVGAVGDSDSSIILHNQSATDRSRLSLCLEPVNDQPQRFQVPLFRLDSILDQQGITRVRLLKIDVEGYELEVLNGLGESSNLVDNIILEVLGAPLKLTAKSFELLERIKSHGYYLHTVDGEPWSPGNLLPENNVWASRNADNL